MSIFSSPVKRIPCFSFLYKIVFFASFSLILTGNANGEIDFTQNNISAITAKQDGQSITITISGSTEPAYTVYELFNPSRIIVDIANSATSPELTLDSQADIPISLTTKLIADATPPINRFEFTLSESLSFETTRQDDNIVISINTEGGGNLTEIQPDLQDSELTIISDIKISSTSTETTVTIEANNKISDFTYDVLDKDEDNSPRLYIDINQASGNELLPLQNIGTILDKIRVAQRNSGIRIVLDSSQDSLFPFQISEIENGLQITITEQDQQVDQISSLINQEKEIDDQLPTISPIAEPSTSNEQQETPSLDPQADDASAEMKDNFTFSGYNKERITVDFYKIDLHNVFRLLREISGQNIVVDEAVSGALTLALNDVPWDFALDVIVNVKDLQKEERFNTIVILPQDKAFSWPNRAEDNLTFEAVEEIAVEEAIIIQQRQNLPKTVIEAKKLISKGKKLENDGDYENAINHYNDAFTKWPQNSELANKISSIYLVQLRQNANAVHYAKKAVEIDSQNMKASLNAAIGLANMRKYDEAQQYFDQSISGKNPSKESLLSYAVFSEERQLYDSAIKLLQKHDMMHGENLNSMLAHARILDKQGSYDEASEKYTTILLSGFRIPPDLKKYINGRIALSKQ